MWVVPGVHFPLELGRGEQRHYHWQQIHCGDDPSMILVERHAAPVHTTNVAGSEEGAARIGRRKNSLVAQRRDEPAALAPIPEGESPSIRGEHGTLWCERRQ